MKKRIFISLIPAAIVGIVIWASANAQVSDPNYWRKLSGYLYPYPQTASTTIGSSTVNGAFKNINISGTCTGAGCGGGGVASSSVMGVLNAASWSGSDMGVKINNAYASSTNGDVIQTLARQYIPLINQDLLASFSILAV